MAWWWKFLHSWCRIGVEHARATMTPDEFQRWMSA